jgi:SAM-dependent methyltransferase
MPTARALDSYYATYYQGSEEKVTFDLPAALAEHVVRRAFPNVGPEPIDVLDFGGGDGSIARRMGTRLLDRGAKCVRILVVDVNRELAPSDSERIVIRHLDGLAEVGESRYGLVVASAILEHLPDPLAAMRVLLSALRPGGTFYARTPVVVPLLRLARRFGVELDFTFPAHLHDLGQTFWETTMARLAEDSALELVSSAPSLVETTLSKHFLRTIAAHLMKAPSHLLGRLWPFVGGWEVFVRRRSAG